MIPCIQYWELINGFYQIHEIVNNVIRIFFLITFGDIFDIILKCIRNNHSYTIITYQTSIKFTLMFKDIFGLSLAFIIAFLKLISIVKKFIFAAYNNTHVFENSWNNHYKTWLWLKKGIKRRSFHLSLMTKWLHMIC